MRSPYPHADRGPDNPSHRTSSSYLYPVRSVRPFSLRMTSQWLGPCTVMDSVVPRRAGWSFPSATIVSAMPGAKVRVYLFTPAASTFISSLSLLLDGSIFHLPTKGSFAAITYPSPDKQPATTDNHGLTFGPL